MHKVKILIGYHKPATLMKSDIFVPIHVGRALAHKASKDGEMASDQYQWMLDNMIGDDTGDNISEKNREFCELTALYWAWKNYDDLGNPEYIGFMQYRRHLIFKEDFKYNKKIACVDYNYIDQNYMAEVGLVDEKVQNVLKENEIIAYSPLHYPTNVYEQFAELALPPYDLDIEIFEAALELVAERYPEYKEVLSSYLKSQNHFWFNCFVMKKELFFEFCEFAFDILFLLDKKFDLDEETHNGKRILGYIAERLQGIFYTYQMNKNVKMKYLPLTFIKNTELSYFSLDENKEIINVCFSSDNNYASYLGVAIKSLILNLDSNDYCNIYVLEDNIKQFNQQLIKKMATERVNIIFIDIRRYLNDDLIRSFHVSDHFTPATYYRIFLGEIFYNIKRIIYLDSDIVVNRNIRELFEFNLNGQTMAAAPDVEMQRAIYSERRWREKYWEPYLKEVLLLEKPKEYFQAGVLVIDLEKFREGNYREKCLELMKKVTPRYVDQCILNSVFQTDVVKIPINWNIEWFLLENKSLINSLSAKDYDGYMDAVKDPYIIHYCGNPKPWKDINMELSEYFWYYARFTSFYERIIFDNLKKNNNQELFSDFFLVNDYSYSKRRYKVYSILSKIAIFGRWKRKFRKKKEYHKLRMKKANVLKQKYKHRK